MEKTKRGGKWNGGDEDGGWGEGEGCEGEEGSCPGLRGRNSLRPRPHQFKLPGPTGFLPHANFALVPRGNGVRGRQAWGGESMDQGDRRA